MFYHIFKHLGEHYDIPGSGMFQYISFRAAAAIILALLIVIIFGRKIIDFLRRKQIGEDIRDLGLEGQLQKRGTPTMGGVIILLAILVPILLFGRLDNIYIQLMIVSTVWLGLIGGLDDYIKVFRHNKEGLKGRFKIVGQVGLGIIVGTTMWLSPQIIVREKVTQPVQTVYLNPDGSVIESVQRNVVLSSESTKTTKTTIPFVKNNEFDYGWLTGETSAATWLLYVLVAIFVVTAVSNGANLTDGLDGLAILPENDTLYAPCDGEVTVLMDESRHACGLTLENGMEILLHIGIDTVEMQGDGFEYLVSLNQKVKQGTPLVRFDREKIRTAGHPDVTVCIVTEEGNAKDFEFVTDIHAEAGKTEIVLFN